MSKLVWNETGKKLYETGVDKMVLYPETSGTYSNGVAWSGVTGFTESPSGADATKIYADNRKYLTLRGPEDYGATIKCYQYPPEWEKCNGLISPVKGLYFGQQPRSTFGLSCRTVIGNDLEGSKHGYKLHLIYGATCSPSERDYGTINDSPEAIEFSYEISADPVSVASLTTEGKEYEPLASIIIDSTEVEPTKLAALEKILYGDNAEESTPARLPLPDEVITLLKGE